MIAQVDRFISLLLLLLISAKCAATERSFAELEQMLSDAKNYRRSVDAEKSSPVWLEYEFESGAGNREELVVANISLHEQAALPDSNWLYVESNGTRYLATANSTMLSLYTVANEFSMDELATLAVDGEILKFRIVNALDIQGENEILAVLCVGSDSGTSLRWFRLVGKAFQMLWQIPVQKHMSDLEFLKDGDQMRVLLLESNGGPFGKQYSQLDVCTVTIDLSNPDYSSWLCQSILLPKSFRIQVCPTYERTLLTLQGMDEVYLYEYENTVNGIVLSALDPIKSHRLRNFVCFECGYVEYLAISGPQAGLYNFLENEFQFNCESEKHFELADISWVTHVPLDTYRDESLLLFQLKNTSVIALSWQGLTFRRVSLPNNDLDQIDLSRSTAIPGFGLISGRKVLKLDIKLKPLTRSVHDDTERIVKIQALLKEVLEHQEGILDKTEERVNKSYLNNPTITGFWDLADVSLLSANISSEVAFEAAAIGLTNLTAEDLYFDPVGHSKVLQKLQEQSEQISNNLDAALDPNSKDLELESDLDITGDVEILGNLTVGNLTVDFINNAPFPTTLDIKSKEFVEILETERLEVARINGVSINDIVLDHSRKDYSHINFSGISQLVINGSLKFSSINNVNWDKLIGNVVWKTKSTFLNGSITINGTVLADDAIIEAVNGRRYPWDYILGNISSAVNITGEKTIDKLTVQNLLGIKRINDIDIEDFVVLNNRNELENEITFDNLRIDEKLQIDGNVTGIEMAPNLSLNETSNVTAHIIFTSLNVLGDIILEDSIGDKSWQSFEDLLQKTEENVKITGNKTFLSGAEMMNVTIASGLINGRRINEYLTIDTDQMLPNLERLEGNVSLGLIRFGVIEKLERLRADCAEAETSSKILIFESPLTVDEFSFERLNWNVSEEAFDDMLKKTFEKVYFDDLSTMTLVSEEIHPETLNNINFSKPIGSSPMDELLIENFQVGDLNVSIINGISREDFERLLNSIDSLLKELSSENISLASLEVKGKVDALQINGERLSEIYNMADRGTVRFESDISIDNLNILGSMNKFNFTERVSESVFKTDKSLKFSGHKKFRGVTCGHLETLAINGHSIENLFDPIKEQTLTGPITINGSVSVLQSFEAQGKIGKVSYHDLLDRFKRSENNTYDLRGDFVFPDGVRVENVFTEETIQGVLFNEFLKRIVSKDEANATVPGGKSFLSTITFNNTLFIHENLNDLNLKKFYERVVLIDTPTSIKSRVIFAEGLELEKDLVVKEKLEVPLVAEVDMNALWDSVLYTNRPIVLTDPTTLKNATFLKNIRVERLNDINMNSIIPLHTDQSVSTEVLNCDNITVEKLDISGMINSHKLEEIYENTFMLFGNQTITGNINFHGRVYVRGNFDAKFINGINPKQIASTNNREKLTGNFVFKQPIVLNGSLRVLGHLNEFDPQYWQATAVWKNAPQKQLVTGKWAIHGNLHLGEHISGALNGIGVTEAASKTNLTVPCEDLNRLKYYAENQAYLYNNFEFLQSLSFESRIVSLHHFEVKNRDYLFISFETCQMNAFVFNGEEFELVIGIPNFGAIDQWTFKNENVLYFLTNGLCEKSRVNLWKLEHDQFVHVLDLGNRTYSGRINEDAFLTLINDRIDRRSILQSSDEVRESIFPLPNDERLKYALDADRSVPAHRQSISDHSSYSESQRAGNEELTFKAGIFQRQLYLYYDEKLSEDNIFICNFDMAQRKILQTLTAHRPSAFTAINFENAIETLLVFVENGRYLRIYEYKGIEGFVYRGTIKQETERLFTFKMRKYTDLARRHYIAAINGDRLTIFEAKMHGEKLDIKHYPCGTR